MATDLDAIAASSLSVTDTVLHESWVIVGHEVLLESPQELKDPVTSLEIIYPLDGSIEKSPVEFASKIVVRPGSESFLFAAIYKDKMLCVEVNKVPLSCYAIDSSGLVFEDWKPGNYSLRVFIADESSTDNRYWQSAETNFQLVNNDAFDGYVMQLLEEEHPKYRPGYDQSLTQWAEDQQRQLDEDTLIRLQRNDGRIKPMSVQPQSDPSKDDIDEELILLIGVKTATVTNFPLRQAMRETWASEQALPRGVKLFFLGCRPFTSIESSADGERRRQWDAIELEKRVYGDLLTDELNCDDNYLGLADKVKEFLHLAATHFAHAQYIMIADDDIHVRLDEVVVHLREQGQRQRYYSGQILQLEPIRTPGNRNELPMEQYPLRQLPPFALGEYFFLSMDCVQFISKNRRRLRDLGGMDDISIPLWLLAIQVHPQHYNGLEHLRARPCIGEPAVLGDLSPLAIRAIHANIAAERSYCHGFSRYAWLKPPSLAPPAGFAYSLPEFRELLEIEISLRETSLPRQVEVTTVIFTATRAGVKLSCPTSSETFQRYSHRVCGEARLRFPGAFGTTFCKDLCHRLRSEILALDTSSSNVLTLAEWSDSSE